MSSPDPVVKLLLIALNEIAAFGDESGAAKTARTALTDYRRTWIALNAYRDRK